MYKELWEGGLAKQLSNKYQNLEKEYSEFCKIHNNNYRQLKGKVFKIMIQGKFIMNIFSQKENFDTDYEAIRICLKEVKDYAKDFNLSISIPYGIGCGIANGEWKIVYKIIEEIFNDYDITIYRLED